MSARFRIKQNGFAGGERVAQGEGVSVKVYIVEVGCYSDRHISGVFSTRDKAEAHIALNGPQDTRDSAGEIEEYELDERAGEVKTTRHSASIDLETGEIFQTESHPWHAQPTKRIDPPEINDFRIHRRSDNKFCPKSFGRISAEVHSFVSMEHALKLAVEQRQEYLRQKMGRES